ncbi:cobyrinic acid a,c-diamide synthase [Lyngbya aestuarii]|uniref:cobyrinic acid a,c-diamide synthase n=1 Tax=Lyngbya aestuarii TaxID=118322 RepID=UPI00403D9D6F
MDEPNYQKPYPSEIIRDFDIFQIVPQEIKEWVEGLPIDERSYVLLLCHLISVATPETKSDFLDNYAADSLVSKMLEDKVPQQILKKYLCKFYIQQEISDLLLKKYINQFYIHSAQNRHTQPELYLKIVLRLFSSLKERNNLLNYILGFEIIKMIFKMSWLQHERLYSLQKSPETFIKNFIKPVQHAHRVNKIIIPVHEKVFFAKRRYFIEKPQIEDKKLVELVMATFPTHKVAKLGFFIIYNPNFLVFDYEYIFNSDPESIFL